MQPAYPGIVPTVTAAQRSRKGLLTCAKEVVFGERDEHEEAIKELKRHGSRFRAFAHWFSYLMLFFFTAQGVLAQVSDEAQAVWNAAQAGHMPDMNKLLTVIVVAGFNVGLDIAIIAMAEVIRHAYAEGKAFPEPGGATTFVAIGGGVEALTYIVVVLGVEKVGWVHAGLTIIRGLLLPFVVIVLATLAARAFGVKDFQQYHSTQFSHYLNKYFNFMFKQVNINEIDGGALVAGFSSVNDLTDAQAAQMQNLAQAVGMIVPNQAQARIQAQIDAARQEGEALAREAMQRAEAVEERAKQMLHEMQETLREREREDKHRLYEMALHLSQHGTFPPELVEEHPSLASFNLANTRGPRGPKPPTLRTPRTRAEAYRAFLDEVGVTPVETPEGRRGVWIKSSDVGRLIDGQLAVERRNNIMRQYGNELTAGRSYIAPIDDVMEELFTLHMVKQPVAQAWHKYVPSSSSEQGDVAANLDENDDANEHDSRAETAA